MLALQLQYAQLALDEHIANTQVAEVQLLHPEDYEKYAWNKALELGVDPVTFTATLECESRFKPNAVGDNGNSFGIAQIHLPSHPSVTRATALDGKWAIDWAAYQFSKGKERMWTCYRMLEAARSRTVVATAKSPDME